MNTSKAAVHVFTVGGNLHPSQVECGVSNPECVLIFCIDIRVSQAYSPAGYNMLEWQASREQTRCTGGARRAKAQ